MYSFKDRLRDWVSNLKGRLGDWANQRGAWSHILMAVGITLVVLAIVLGAAMPSKGQVNTNKVDIGGIKNSLAAVVDGLTTKASQAALDEFSTTVTGALGDQELDITALQARANATDNKINEAKGDINAIRNDLEELTCSPPEGYLAGSFGNYTLYAECNEAGNFTANVHLVYSPMVGTAANHTAIVDSFYASVDWGVNATIPSYVPVPSFDGTAWGISEVWWNVGTFALAAKTEKAIDITCAGLNSTWAPSYAYVEVWPVL